MKKQSKEPRLVFRVFMLCMLIHMIGFASVSGQTRSNRDLPVDSVALSDIRIVDGTTYCQTGTGQTGYVLEIGDEKMKISSTTGNLGRTPFIEAGCVMSGWGLKYRLIELNDFSAGAFTSQGSSYNRVDIRAQSVSAGYEFGLIRHRLMVKAGGGWQSSEVQYALELNQTVTKGEKKQHTDQVAFFGLKLFITPRVYIGWERQQQVGGDSPVKSFDVFGIHLTVRVDS